MEGPFTCQTRRPLPPFGRRVSGMVDALDISSYRLEPVTTWIMYITGVVLNLDYGGNIA